MSTTYSIQILPQPNPTNAIRMVVEATNHEGQLLPTTPIFYFSLMGSIYWALHEERDGYGHGLYVDAPKPPPSIRQTIPILDHYIKWGKEEPHIYSPYPEDIELEELLTITVEAETRNAYNCVEGTLLATINDPTILAVAKLVQKVSVVFDDAYF